KIADYNYKL
nr:Chain C, SARS-CoV-2 T-cell Epitope S1 [Severe acute respiratory syndrome coronavirus 2]7EU2_F Chain F, SARS-CoV-2 T-cell Epitope S1 [Severe acute respiratory syndrome coronavirus 2]